MTDEICTSLMKCAFDFQTLISGLFAILAAVGTAYVIWRAANLPIERQAAEVRATAERRRQYVYSVLSNDFSLLAARARQAEGTIKVVMASNTNVSDETRKRTRLALHPMVDDWESMSLLPIEIQRNVLKLRRKVSDHNFDMDRAGGAFGADNFRRAILEQVKSIQVFAARLGGQIGALVP